MRTLIVGIMLAACTLTAPAVAQQPGMPQDRNSHGEGNDRDGHRTDGQRGDRGRGPDGEQGRRGERGHAPGSDQGSRGDHRSGGDRGRGDRYAAPRDQRGFRDYDYNRREPGQRGYYAERYYRSGGNYRPSRVSRETRVYRGGDGRYYCRRNDGTTGLIVGAALGGLLGNSVAYGDSRTVATLLGGTGGALLGRSIARGQLSCR